MRNITFSADERLIQQARERAAGQGHTLNEEFRRWLADYVRQEEQLRRFDEVVQEVRGKARVGRTLSREEMSAR
ncbi:MAG: hypothetical protein V2J10_08565 [Wenzhouxiangella sp.]|jgi:hypothetical protein|nr:hypothetical protein [Wenzhouxiangella sp.]